MEKKTVFITGVTGSMGGAGLEELMSRRDRFNLVTLVRPSATNKKKMQKFQGEPGLRIVWGDLTSYEDILQCVSGADIVLHPAAMITPEADYHPAAAKAVNVGSIEKIIRAIKAQPEPDGIKLVNIGSVAMTGDRLAPLHVGRTGDPIIASPFDAYALAKIDAERMVAESGLKYWVSCRQTFVAIPDTMGLLDPVMYHQPLHTCIEFCTARDSGLLLANACEDTVPETFWRKFYNIGGGESARVTFLELLERIFSALGLGKPENLTERNWFALRNFHCQWYEDSSALHEILQFQTMGMDDYVQSVIEGSPWYVSLPTKPGINWLVNLPPARALIKRLLLRPMAFDTPNSTMNWINNNRDDRVAAFFGGREHWEGIPASWDDIPRPSFEEYTRLDHGYDETRPFNELTLEDMQAAAAFRGGQCLSSITDTIDPFTPLEWQCWRGHQFGMTPNTVLKGGYWCPQCAPREMGWDCDQEAAHNPFFAQVWHNTHTASENNYYPADCYMDIAAKR